MNVLMTADAVGGVWTFTLELARALEPLGVTIDLALMGPAPDAAQRSDLAACRNVRLHESTFLLEWMPGAGDDVACAGDWLAHLAHAVRPDVVHLNGYAHAPLDWRAPVLVVGHSCVLSWWRAVHGTDAPPEWNRYRVAVTAGLHAADVVATPTRALLDELRHIYGFDGATAVIPNGCAPVDAPMRDAHRAPVLLAAGRMWDEAKNMTTLAAAARRLERTVHVAGAAVAPDGTARVPPDLHALGPLPHADLCGWYRRASIFIHPALYEPFGLAPLEAALHGCALVLGDIPTLREVWGDAATFVPPRDDAALADAIADLAADPERASARGDAARARALHYDADRMARAYHTLYGAMLAGTTEALACAS